MEAVSKNTGTKQVNKKPPRGPVQPSSRMPQQTRQQQVCTRCGKGPHSRQACPAKDATCYKCNKKGHYSSRCYTKSVSTISEETDPLETAYLNTVEEQDSAQSSWTCHVELNGKTTLFKIDTGAEVFSSE